MGTSLCPFSMPPVQMLPEDTTFDPEHPQARCWWTSSGHLLLQPTIDGQQLGWMLLDTGEPPLLLPAPFHLPSSCTALPRIRKGYTLNLYPLIYRPRGSAHWTGTHAALRCAVAPPSLLAMRRSSPVLHRAMLPHITSGIIVPLGSGLMASGLKPSPSGGLLQPLHCRPTSCQFPPFCLASPAGMYQASL